MSDAFITTLAVATTSGPVTRRLTHALWTLGLMARRPRLLRTLGPALLLLIIATWLLGLWTGWAMVFSAGPEAVVATTSGRVATGWERIYFTGYTLFTLGNGEFRPAGSVWQLLAVLALINGLGLATLSITYVIPVTSAALERRQLAGTIAALGDGPDTALIRAWDGEGFGVLGQRLMVLEPALALLTQRHLGYPVLHFFHSTDRRTAAAPTIAVLDEMVTLLQFGVAAEARLPASTTAPLRAVLTQFLDTLRSAFITPADELPPIPSLDRLRAAGIPTVDDEAFAAHLVDINERRRLLAGLVRNDGWPWETVWRAPDDSEREEPKTDENADELS